MFTLFMSVLFGSVFSYVFDVSLFASSVGVFISSHLVSLGLPKNVLAGAVVYKSVYEAELLKTLKTIKNTFLARVPDKSHLLDGNTINYNKIGAKPNVLINNTTYPIPSAQRTDDGMTVSLKKLTTEGTIITRDEIHNLPYDKKNSVIPQHKESLLEMFYKYALHAFAPNTNTATMPVFKATGADDGTGRKRLTKKNLIQFRRALTEAGIGECDLVLSPEHVEDIMLWSQAFENQYHVIASGLILPLYGFNLTQNVGYAPRYNAGTKVAFGAAPSVGDVHASVAYIPNRMFRAYGSVEMFYTEATAKYHQDEVNFDAYFIADAKDEEGRGAII